MSGFHSERAPLIVKEDDVDADLTSAEDMDLPIFSPLNTQVRKQLNAINSIERRQNNSLFRCLSCRCFLSVFMLILFIILAMAVMQAVVRPYPDKVPLASQYDFIVVGAGPAGCVLSRKLVDAGASVLLLEAGDATQYDIGGTDYFGGPVTRFDIPFLWTSITSYGKFSWPGTLLAKGLGGCGIHNAMIYLRALRSDIDGWNLPGWRWMDFLRAYKQLESFAVMGDEPVPPFHGVDGPMRTSRPTFVDDISPEFVSSAIQAGIPFMEDFNGPDVAREGVGYYHFNIRGGTRDSAARTMLTSLLSSRTHKFKLQLRSTVTRVLLQEPGESSHGKHRAIGRAYCISSMLVFMCGVGVEYESEGGLKTAYLRVNSVPSYLNSFPSGCVILTAGSLNSPKLLMMSGIGPPSTLKDFGIPSLVASDGVGSNVQDHISVGLSYRLDPAAIARLPSMFSLPSLLVRYLTEVDEYKSASLNYSRPASEQRDFGVLGSAGLSVGAFLKSPFAGSEGGPDIQLSVFPAVTEPHIAARAWYVNIEQQSFAYSYQVY